MNEATDIRRGDEIDETRLKEWLAPITGKSIEKIIIRQFAGGYSNLTYQIIINDDIKWVLRKPPKGANIKSGHDMAREYKIIKALYPEYTKVPRPVAYCEDSTIIGTEFYIMDNVDGWILRAHKKADSYPDKKIMHQIYTLFTENFVALHALDYTKCGLDTLGNPQQYPERQISGWTRRYEAAKTDEIRSVATLYKWLNENIPTLSRPSLIHNDYKYDNIIFDKEGKELIAILDWEMSTIGDPLMDLGSTLGYWVNHDDPDWLQEIGLSPTNMPDHPTRENLLHDYADKSGLDPGNGVFYYAYGMLKLAVIAQQIYARYKAGHTSDPRFAGLIKVVEMCGLMGTQAIQKQKLDHLF